MLVLLVRMFLKPLMVHYVHCALPYSEASVQFDLLCLYYVQYIGTYCSFEHYYSSDGTVSGWVGDAG